MLQPPHNSAEAKLDHLYRTHSRMVLATLIRLLGSFEQAEEATHEAFAAAVQQWPRDGIPENPTAWLISTGRNKAIDQMRRQQHANRYAANRDIDGAAELEIDPKVLEDDQLRLIFTCCHPSLPTDVQLAMTLREICGLSTEQVGRALLQKPATIAQRIVRGKRKIHDAGIPYEIPDHRELHSRLQVVLQVIYLMFNESYLQSEGSKLTDSLLASQALHLGKLINGLLPEAEVSGLVALMYLHHARYPARQDAEGNLVTLEEQDRMLWNAEYIRQGLLFLAQSLAEQPPGPYTLQAAIAAQHAQAADYSSTNWPKLVALYEALYQCMPSPVVALNHAAAVGMASSPGEGLRLLAALDSENSLQEYHLYHAACADLQRRAGQTKDAVMSYKKALSLTGHEAEQRFIKQRLASLKK